GSFSSERSLQAVRPRLDLGCSPAARANGYLHDHLYASHHDFDGRSPLSRICLFRATALDIFFDRDFDCCERLVTLSEPSYEDVFSKRNHPPLVPICELHGFLRRFSHLGRLDALLQGFSELAFALCDTNRGDAGGLRDGNRSFFLGAASALS